MKTETKRKKILSLLQKGATYEAIRDKTGAAMATISKVAEMHGIVRSKGRKKSRDYSPATPVKRTRLSSEQKSKILEYLKQGYSQEKIIGLTSASSASISRIAKAHGLDRGQGNSKRLPHHNPHHRKSHPKFSKHRKRAEELSAQGQSLRAIAAELGISHQNVSFLLGNPNKK